MANIDQLEVIGPDGQIRFYDLDAQKGITNIGRHSDNDVVIDSPQVGLFHAILDHRQKPYQIVLLEDQETRLDGQRLLPNLAMTMPNWGTLELDGYTLILVEGEGTSVVSSVAARMPVPAPRLPVAPAPVPAAPAGAPAAPAVAVPSAPPVAVPAEAKAMPATPRLSARPPDQTDEAILVEFPEREGVINVEQTATFPLTITNGGLIVATFQVTVNGVDPAWVTVEPEQVNLYEGQSASLMISITPPREPASRAGPYPLAVVVTSADYPGRSSQRGATVTINPYYEFAMSELSPRQQTLRGRKPVGQAVFHIANKGNSEAPFRLEALDNENACHFEFEVPGQTTRLARQADLRLPPAETFAVPVYITPLRRKFVAMRSHPLSFTVTANMLEGAPVPRSVLGQLQVRPVLGPFPVLLFVLAVLACIVLFFRPHIRTFEARPTEITAGDAVTLSWQTSPFTTRLTLKALVADTRQETVTPLERGARQQEAYPTQDMIYTLVGENLISDLLTPLHLAAIYPLTYTIDVAPLKPRVNLSVDRPTIVAGEKVNLRWEVKNADVAYFSFNGKDEPPLDPTQYTGTREYAPTGNTEVVLRVKNQFDETFASVKITANQPTPTPLPLPIILSFGAAPLDLVAGESVTFTWKVENATKVRLSGPGQEKEYLLEGNTVQTMDAPGVYEYKLIAVFDDGAGIQKPRQQESPPLRINVREKPTPTPVPQKPVIDSFQAVPPQVAAGKPVQLVWAVSGKTTNIQITGPTIGALTNLSGTGTIPVVVNAPTFFILTAYNGDLTASQTVVVNILEPTPTPIPTPVIDYFIAKGTNPDDVTTLESTNNIIRYQIKVGASVQLSWAVRNAAKVTLSLDGNGLGDQPYPEGIYQTIIWSAGQYQLSAFNSAGTSASRFIQVELKPVTPPPAPYNVNGPDTYSVPLPITWSYDPGWVDQVTGFRVYRAAYPYVLFDRLADESVLNNTARRWEDPTPACGLAYYVVAVYWDMASSSFKETPPSPNTWYSWPCPTVTPGP